MTHHPAHRIRLETPLEGSFGSASGAIVEIGSRSVVLECEVVIAAARRSWLTFRAGGGIFRLPAVVVSCRVIRSSSLATGRLHYRAELTLGELPAEVQRDLDELVTILAVDAPAERLTEALQFEIVGF